MSSCQHVILSTCHLVNRSTHHHVILLTCQHVKLSSCQLVNMLLCQLVNLSTCQHVNMSTCQTVNFSTLPLSVSESVGGQSFGFVFLWFCACSKCYWPLCQKAQQQVKPVLNRQNTGKITKIQGFYGRFSTNDCIYGRFSTNGCIYRRACIYMGDVGTLDLKHS